MYSLRIAMYSLGIARYRDVLPCIATYFRVSPCIVMYSLGIAMYYNVFCSGYMTPCVAIHDTHVEADQHTTPHVSPDRYLCPCSIGQYFDVSEQIHVSLRIRI